VPGRTIPRRRAGTAALALMSRRVVAAALVLLLVALATRYPAFGGAPTRPPAGSAPSARTRSAASVTSTAATLRGTLDARGLPTTYSFDFGRSAAYGLKSVSISAGSGTHTSRVHARTFGLTPSSTYHYRIAARNAAGTSYGADRTFRTGATSVGQRASSPDPPGVPAPAANPPGWHEVFEDDFTGTSLGRCWGAYSGPPASSPTGMWAPSHISVAGGEVRLRAYRDPRYGTRWVSAGMSLAPCLVRRYGLYEVRFRADAGDGVKYTILLWPATVPWPCGGEIDFAEDGGGPRTVTTLTVHYCDGSGHAQMLPQRLASANFTQWHTIAVEWEPGTLTWLLDGRTLARVNSPLVPSDPLELDIQSETNTDCGLAYFTCIDARTPAEVDLDVAWVAVFAPQ